MTMSFMDQRIDFAACFRWAARQGWQSGICNHFSWLVDDNHILINPQGLFWSEIRASDLVLLDRENNIVEGTGEVEPTAFFVHVPTHRLNPNAKVILHVHTPYATSLTCVKGGKLSFCHQDSLRFYGRIAYDDEFNGAVLDEEEGTRIAKKLGNHQIMFMAHHGVSAVGQTVAEALDDLYYLEEACRVQVLAMSTGLPLKEIDEDKAEAIVARRKGTNGQIDPHFEAIKRILDREEPDYRN